jgi:superfamily I DNA/RNA helicase
VIFADEAQDFTRLQLTLVRKWGESAEYFLCVGDDDQTIYTFTGATPDAFLKPDVPADQKIILSQSYRVPQAVHALATGWISRVAHREPKEYQPTSALGIVKNVPFAWTDPGRLIGGALKEVEAGRTVMFLAACAYMLVPVRTALMERAIPFHNPYRLRRGDWNPLRSGNGLSASDRVLAFAKPHNAMGANARPWNAADYRRWAEWLVAATTFNRGGKSAARNLPDELPVTMDDLHRWLTPGAYDALMNGIMNGTLPEHLGWWFDRVEQTHQRTAAYPTRIAIRHGLQALAERPRIILGTIHSVKGGEADTVILFPDLSAAGFAQWDQGGDGYDAVVRQFYVAMTRARSKLIICAAAGGQGVDL